MRRRDMLGSLFRGGIGGTLLAVGGGCSDGRGGSARDELDVPYGERLENVFKGAGAAAGLVLGKRALAKLGPLRADFTALCRKVFASEDWEALEGDDEDRVAAMVKADFVRGRVARVDGWTVSFTELYLASAYALWMEGAGDQPALKQGKREGPDPGDAKRGNARRGEAVYEQHCQSCHQRDGKGLDGKTAPDLTKRLATGGRAAWRDAIVTGRETATGKMPAFGPVLSDEEVDDVLEYVSAEFSPG